MRARVLVVVLLGATVAVARAAQPTPEELERQQNTVERHLLRVQQERFEARARGEDPKKLRRLEREFRRTYGRRNAIIDERKTLEAAE